VLLTLTHGKPCNPYNLRSTATGVETEEHPLDAYFRELLRRRRLLSSQATADESMDGEAGDSGADIHGRMPADARTAQHPSQHDSAAASPAPDEQRAISAHGASASPQQEFQPAPAQALPIRRKNRSLEELLAAVEDVKRAAGSRPSARASATDDAVQQGTDVTRVLRRAMSFSDVEGELAAFGHRRLTNVRCWAGIEVWGGRKETLSVMAGRVCCASIVLRPPPPASPPAHAQIQESKPSDHSVKREHISVAIRCRPPAPHTHDSRVWTFSPADRRVVLSPDASGDHACYFGAVQRHGKKVNLQDFQFDAVFDEHASTRQVYQSAAQAIVLSALDGINAGVLAYGQTG